MTKAEILKREIALKELLEHASYIGFSIDRYGNWKHRTGKYRIKLNPNKVRIEYKSKFGGWKRYYSIYNRDLLDNIELVKRHMDRLILII